MADDWGIITTPEDYARSIQKRLMRQERRLDTTIVVDNLGPSLGSTATETDDWNSSTCVKNGFVYSRAGAKHAPTAEAVDWSGIIIARSDGSGSQDVWDPSYTADTLHWTRMFAPSTEDPDVVVFGDWREFATHSGKIDFPQLSTGVKYDIQKALDDSAEALGFEGSIIKVFRQPTMPAGPLPNGSLWFNTADGNHPYVWNSTTNAWVDSQDASAAAGEAAAEAAQETANQALADAAAAFEQAQAADGGQSTNPTFDIWPSPTAPPTDYAAWSGGAVGPGLVFEREQVITRTSPYALRMRVPAGANVGFSYVAASANVSLAKYVTVTLDFYLVSGDLSGAGLTVDFIDPSNVENRTIITHPDYCTPSIGKWQRLTKTVRCPDGVTISSIRGYLLGGWSGLPGGISAKDIIFDRLDWRPASPEEIAAYDAPGGINLARTEVIPGTRLAADAIDGKIITGATIQTTAAAARGIKLGTVAMVAYNPIGTPTFSITAATGDVVIRGSLTAGSDVSGATVTGGTVQTEATAARGIKINSGGMIAYNSTGSIIFQLLATGTILATGPIVTGGEVNGAIVTGGTLQTTSTALRGIKINSAGLAAYDGAGSATLTINASTGAIIMKGDLTSGSTITGATLSTAPSGQRVVIGASGATNQVSFYSGAATETVPGAVDIGVTSAAVTGGTLYTSTVTLRAPIMSGSGYTSQNASIAIGSKLNTGTTSDHTSSSIILRANSLTLVSPTASTMDFVSMDATLITMNGKLVLTGTAPTFLNQQYQGVSATNGSNIGGMTSVGISTGAVLATWSPVKPTDASMVWLKATVPARCFEGNQALDYYLEVSIAGGTWTAIDHSYEHNNTDAYTSLNGSLGGWAAFPLTSAIQARVRVAVGGGVGSVRFGAVNFNGSFFR